MFTEFPAPAGINRYRTVLNRQKNRVPRASGDKPTGTNHSSVIVMSSPRQRG
ncbi:hypothetical protein ECEPECC34262_3599 [Escherichia coli EPEC C342-62]|nr:hypothetical protein ECEPECC34262_3599 [Escherichia coli EPEC C342-62]